MSARNRVCPATIVNEARLVRGQAAGAPSVCLLSGVAPSRPVPSGSRSWTHSSSLLPPGPAGAAWRLPGKGWARGPRGLLSPPSAEVGAKEPSGMGVGARAPAAALRGLAGCRPGVRQAATARTPPPGAPARTLFFGETLLPSAAAEQLRGRPQPRAGRMAWHVLCLTKVTCASQVPLWPATCSMQAPQVLYT